MSEQVWQHQIRVNLREDFAQAVNKRMGSFFWGIVTDAVRQYFLLKPTDARQFIDVLDRYNATMKNQFAAFSDYCKWAEESGETNTTLYRWTKDTIEKPGKKEHYALRFTIYADGGKEVYAKEIADKLEADLQPFLEKGLVTKVSNIGSDPAKNPQAPARFTQG